MESKRLNLTIPGWLYNKYIKEHGREPERVRELITKGIMFEKENESTNNGINGIQSQDLLDFVRFPTFVT
jgi:hypothetical protein